MTEIASISCNSSAFARLSTDILQGGSSLRFMAHGTSMHPLVRDGDLLQVQPVEASLIQIADVVLCSLPADCIVVHRVLYRRPSREGLEFLVQGDQVGEPDGWIPQAQVYGRLAAIERAGVEIDLQRPLMRALGWFAAFRSHLRFARLKVFCLTRKLLVPHWNLE